QEPLCRRTDTICHDIDNEHPFAAHTSPVSRGVSMKAMSEAFEAHLRRRHRLGRVFHGVCFFATLFGLVSLLILLAGIAWQAYGWLDIDFLTSMQSRDPEKAGILAGIWGSLWLIGLTAIFAVPAGVGAAIYLEEYAPDNWLTRLIQVNLSNL